MYDNFQTMKENLDDISNIAFWLIIDKAEREKKETHLRWWPEVDKKRKKDKLQSGELYKKQKQTKNFCYKITKKAN